MALGPRLLLIGLICLTVSFLSVSLGRAESPAPGSAAKPALTPSALTQTEHSLSFARMVAGDAVQMNGFGSALCSAR